MMQTTRVEKRFESTHFLISKERFAVLLGGIPLIEEEEDDSPNMVVTRKRTKLS